MRDPDQTDDSIPARPARGANARAGGPQDADLVPGSRRERFEPTGRLNSRLWIAVGSVVGVALLALAWHGFKTATQRQREVEAARGGPGPSAPTNPVVAPAPEQKPPASPATALAPRPPKPAEVPKESPAARLKRLDDEAMRLFKEGSRAEGLKKLAAAVAVYKDRTAEDCEPAEALLLSAVYNRMLTLTVLTRPRDEAVAWEVVALRYAKRGGLSEETYHEWANQIARATMAAAGPK